MPTDVAPRVGGDRDCGEWRFTPGDRSRRRQSFRRCPKCGPIGDLRRVDEPAWLEYVLDSSWKVAYRLGEQHGRPVIEEIRVLPRNTGGRERGTLSVDRVPAAGVPARMLRHIRTEEVLDVLRQFKGAITKLLESSSPSDVAPAAASAIRLRTQGIETLDGGRPEGGHLCPTSTRRRQRPGCGPPTCPVAIGTSRQPEHAMKRSSVIQDPRGDPPISLRPGTFDAPQPPFDGDV